MNTSQKRFDGGRGDELVSHGASGNMTIAMPNSKRVLVARMSMGGKVTMVSSRLHQGEPK